MVLYIKTPQLIGIIAGCIVFTITISIVIYLLYASGTIHGFINELRYPQGDNKQSTESNNNSTDVLPKLHSYILNSRQNANLLVTDETILKELFKASNGSPLFNESAYHPSTFWSWMDLDNTKPWLDIECFRRFHESSKHVHIVIVDNEMQQPIGLITLSKSEVMYLSVSIERIWITPAYQRKKKSIEAIFLILQYFFESNFRRISTEIDSRNLIAKKMLIRCGFLLEGTLRKHKIVNDCNRDTCIYSIINSDWVDTEGRLRNYIGMPLTIKKQKIASIDTSIKFSPVISQENKCNTFDNTLNKANEITDSKTLSKKKKNKRRSN